jgi:hypothetical protein
VALDVSLVLKIVVLAVLKQDAGYNIYAQGKAEETGANYSIRKLHGLYKVRSRSMSLAGDVTLTGQEKCIQNFSKVLKLFFNPYPAHVENMVSS